MTALPLLQPVPLDLARLSPSVPHRVRPIPVFIKLLQALEVDRREVRADPLPNPPPPLAGVLSPGSAEFVLEMFPSDPPAEKQSTACSGGEERCRAEVERLRTLFTVPWEWSF